MTSIFSIQNVPHHHHHNSFHNYQHHSQAQPQFVPVQQQQAPAIHIPLQDERHILAERFKTKMCRNFLTQGFCPYESRCMFAHGDAEMRTAEMNIRDGLFTEEAIKAFKRAHRMVERAEAAAMLPPPPAYTDAIERDANNAPMLVNSNAAPDYFQQPQYTHSPQMENESFEQDLYPDTPASRNQEEFVEEGGEYQDDCESLSGAVEHQDGLNGIHNEGNSNSSSVNSRTAVPLYRHNPYSLATPFEVMPVKTISGMMNAHVMP